MNHVAQIVEIGSGTVFTRGLSYIDGQKELRLSVQPVELLPAARLTLGCFVEYIEQGGRRIGAGETVDWGSRLIKFISASDGYLDAWDVAKGGLFQRGCSRAVETWAAQNDVCREHNSPYTPTLYSQLAVVSPGVLADDGEFVGERYASEEQMSGWWFYAHRYDRKGDGFESMKPTHIRHILDRHPAVGPFLALAEGFGFDPNPDEVWKF